MIMEDLQGETLFAKMQNNPNLSTSDIKGFLSQFLDTFYYQLLVKEELHSEMHAHKFIVDPQNRLHLLGTNQVTKADRKTLTEVLRVYFGILRGDANQVMQGFLRHGKSNSEVDIQRATQKIQSILDKHQFQKQSFIQFLLKASNLTQTSLHRRSVIAMTEIAFVLVNEEGFKPRSQFIDFYLALLPSLGTLVNLAFKLPAQELKKFLLIHGIKFAVKGASYGIKKAILEKLTSKKTERLHLGSALRCEMIFSN